MTLKMQRPASIHSDTNTLVAIESANVYIVRMDVVDPARDEPTIPDTVPYELLK